MKLPLWKLVKGVGREPNDILKTITQSYKNRYAIDTPEYGPVTRLDTAQSARIADAFHAMQHQPQDERTRASYDALKKETLNQYRHLLRAGYTFHPHTGEGEPYRDSAEMMDDLRHNKRMAFYLTEHGFGTNEADAAHPLLEKTPYSLDGKPLLYNDVFRIVHDVFGHAVEGHQFGPTGEENAWRKHSSMYSDLARPALTAETRGQNSWVNFGPHIRRSDGSVPKKGDPDYIHPAERPYADQKAGLLPDEFNTPQAENPARHVVIVRKSVQFQGETAWDAIVNHHSLDIVEEDEFQHFCAHKKVAMSLPALEQAYSSWQRAWVGL